MIASQLTAMLYLFPQLGCGLLLHNDSGGAAVGHHLPGGQHQEEQDGDAPGGAVDGGLQGGEQHEH